MLSYKHQIISFSKKITTIFSIVLLALILGNCERDEVCDVVNLSDLVVNDIKTNFKSDESDGKVYTIIGAILNTVADLNECQEDKAPAADENQYEQKIEYSSDSNFTSPVTVDKQDYRVKKLEAGQSEDVGDEIKFIVDGYYRVKGTADIDEEVKERNENNNVKEKAAGGRLANTYYSDQIIEIKGFSKKPKIDNKGNEIYIQHL